MNDVEKPTRDCSRLDFVLRKEYISFSKMFYQRKKYLNQST